MILRVMNKSILQMENENVERFVLRERYEKGKSFF